MACPFAQPNSQVDTIAPFSQFIESPALPLSLQMKLKTAALHSEVERCLELPQKITTIYEYGRCLRHFYRLYQPLEASTNHFAEWSGLGLDMRERNLTSRLRKDLFALGISEVEMDLTAFDARKLSNFDYAFGVRYVIEGSTLGAQHILRHARAVLGKQIDGADSFFLDTSRGPELCGMTSVPLSIPTGYDSLSAQMVSLRVPWLHSVRC